MKASNRFLKLSAPVLWGGLVCIAISGMDRYDNTPGTVGAGPEQWPGASSLSLSRDHLTLVVFLHPQCPCSQATLAQLEQLLARNPGRFQATAVAIIPRARLNDWPHSTLLNRAAAIPGMRVFVDLGGVEALRFGAATSGFTLAYSSAGTLRFAGGVTAARGEEGDNLGISALDDLARDSTHLRRSSPVFGCELRNNSPLRAAKSR